MPLLTGVQCGRSLYGVAFRLVCDFKKYLLNLEPYIYTTIWIDGCSLDVGIVSITPKPFLRDNIGSKQNSLQAQQKNEAIF